MLAHCKHSGHVLAGATAAYYDGRLSTDTCCSLVTVQHLVGLTGYFRRLLGQRSNGNRKLRADAWQRANSISPLLALGASRPVLPILITKLMVPVALLAGRSL